MVLSIILTKLQKSISASVPSRVEFVRDLTLVLIHFIVWFIWRNYENVKCDFWTWEAWTLGFECLVDSVVWMSTLLSSFLTKKKKKKKRKKKKIVREKDKTKGKNFLKVWFKKNCKIFIFFNSFVGFLDILKSSYVYLQLFPK